MVNRITRHLFSFLSIMDHEGRGIEYHMTKVLFFYALILFLPGQTLNWETYAHLFRLGITETVVAAAVLALSIFRGMSLYVNGYHYRTPALRAVTSFLSCLLWGMLTYNVWVEYFTGALARPAVTMAFYPAFVLAEFRAASRLRWERVYATH